MWNLLLDRVGCGRLWVFGLALVSLLTMSGQGAAAPIAISDGTFNDSDYSQVDVSLTGAAFGSASTLTSGGNPGSFREISLFVSAFETATVAQIFDVMSITPSADGLIVSASWSIDARNTFTSTGATQIVAGVAIQQDGVTRTRIIGIADSTDWQHFLAGDIVPLFPDVNWTSGSEIKFGFFNSTTSGSVPLDLGGGYDNFTVVADVEGEIIPEPSTALLLAVGVFGLMSVQFRLRRQRRKLA